MSDVCSVNANASSVATILCHTNPSLGLSTTTVDQLIKQGIERGYFTKEDSEQRGVGFLCESIINMLNDESEINTDFPSLSPLAVSSAEGFAGDSARAMHSTHYIGANKAGTNGLQVKMLNAFSNAQDRTVVNDTTQVDPNTVAMVEVTTNSDLNAVFAQCQRVLEAGGRLLLPSAKEVSDYAKNIKDDKTREAYQNMRLRLQNALISKGYSIRNVEADNGSFAAQIVQKVKTQVVEKLEFPKDSKVAKVKALNDGVDAKAIADKAKSMNIKINNTFVNKEGINNKAEGIKAQTLYAAIKEGEVDAIARPDSKTNEYSSLKVGDIIPLRQDSEHIIYAEVTDVQTGVSKSDYIQKLNDGSVTTGYSASSAQVNIKDDASLSIIKFKPLAEGSNKKTGSKSKSSSNDSNTKTVKRRRYARKKGGGYRVWWETVKIPQNQVNTITLLNSLADILIKSLQKAGVNVEFVQDAQIAKALESDEIKELRQQLEQSDPSERAAIARDLGYKQDMANVLGIRHTVRGEFFERQALLSLIFHGDFARMDQFGKSLMAYFRDTAERTVLPEKIEEYTAEIERLEQLIKNGLNENDQLALRSEKNALKNKKRALVAKRAVLKNEGWLGAVKYSDVLTQVLRVVSHEMNGAKSVAKFINKCREDEQNKGKTSKELVSLAEKQFNVEDLPSYTFFSLAVSDLTQTPFLAKLYDGIGEYTSSEAGIEITDENRQEWEAKDADIMKRRQMSEAIRRAMFDRVCYEITKATGVRVSMRTLSHEGEVTEEDEVNEEANDAEAQEDNDRDIQMVSNFQRDVSSTLSKKVKRILGSQCEWESETETLTGTAEQNKARVAEFKAEWEGWEDCYEILYDKDNNPTAIRTYYQVKEEMFGLPKTMAFGVVFNRLLNILNSANNGLGMRNGEELYQYLKDNQQAVSWYHGVVAAMEKDQTLKTAFYTAFKKRHMKFRSTASREGVFGDSQMRDQSKKQYNSIVSIPENFDENAEFLAAAMQEIITNGMILSHGPLRGVKVTVSENIQVGKNRTTYKGSDIELSDISLYNASGLFNEGTIVGDRDARGNYTSITKMTGAYGFCALVKSLPRRMKNIENLLIEGADQDHTADKVLYALRALGVEITRQQFELAFLAHQDLLNKCVTALHTIAEMADPRQYTEYGAGNKGLYTDVVYDHFSTQMGLISESLVGLSEMTAEASFRWASKTYYAWANPTMLDEVTDELGNDMSDEDFNKYVNERYYNANDPEVSETFFMQRDADGSIRPTCTWLKLMTPATSEKNEVERAHFFRRLLRMGYFANLGVAESTDTRDVVSDYEHMSAAQKTAIEVLNYFSPKYGKYKDLKTAAKGGLDFNPYDVALYAFPIMADSGNHIFFGGRRYKTKRESGSEEMLFGQSIDSHVPDSLLDGCADVVMQEYNRIKVYRSNAINGQEIKRTPLYKTLNKNKEKFINFPDLNNVKVQITQDMVGAMPRVMSFIEAIEYLSTLDNAEAIIKDVKVSKDEVNWHTVSRTEGVELYRDMIMEAVHKCFLNDSFERSLAIWERNGIFKQSSEGFINLQSEDDTFATAFKQIDDRKDAVHDLLKQLFEQDVRIVKNADGTFSIDKPNVSLNSFSLEVSDKPLESSVWNQMAEFEDITNGIRRGDLTQFILGCSDMWFNKNLYKLNEQERMREEARQKLIVANISSIIGGLSTDLKSGSHKLNLLLTKTEQSRAYRNLLVEAMQDYTWNKTFAKSQILQLTVGDIAQFKNEGDLSKRFKGVVAAYERCDMSATDPYRGDRFVKDYYGETAIQDEKWKENQKCITIADFEAKKEKGSDRSTGFVNISDFFNTQLLPLLQQDLDAGVIDRQTYADYCSGYTKMTVSDGQSFRTLESMRKMCQFLGLNTEGMEDIYQKVVVDGETLKWEDVRDFMQQMKTVSFGYQQLLVEYSANDYGNTQGAMKLRKYSQQLIDFTKDSQFTLMLYTDEMNKYLGGSENILKGMLDFARKNQVDCIHFESTKKTGQTNVIDLTQCRNAQEVEAALNAAKQAGEADPTLDIFHAESWRNVGRQISTPEHLIDKEQGQGSQLEKLIEADLPNTYEGSVINPQTGKAEKRTFATYITLRDQDGNAIDKLTPSQYKEYLTRLKITNMREDLLALEKEIGSKEALSKLLIDQIDRTDKYQDDLKDALTIDSTGEFRLPLDNPVVLRSIEPLIGSLIRKHVIKQKTMGGTAIQFTQVGRSENLKEVWGEDENGQPYVKYIECMLPAWSKKLFQAFADEDGNIDIDKVPTKLREMVGYRVPTEYMYSMAPLRVVGFLPQAQGSSIMLPQEIVVWSGSDFDIDKMFLEIPEFKIIDQKEVLNCTNKEAWAGFYQTEVGKKWLDRCLEHWNTLAERYINDNPDLDEATKNKIHDIASNPTSDPVAFRNFRQQWCKLAGSGKGRIFDSLAVDPTKEEAYDELRHDFQWYLENNGYYDYLVKLSDNTQLTGRSTQADIDKASRMDRNNMLIALHFARLTCPQTLRALNQPGGFSVQKKMARIMAILDSGESNQSFADLASRSFDDEKNADDSVVREGLDSIADKYSSRLDILDAATDDLMFERNMTGKTMVAISALHNSFHAMIQNAPLTLSNTFLADHSFVLNGKPMRTVLGSIYDESGHSIIRNIGGFLAAAVDNAKDPVLGEINMNPKTAEWAMALLHMGYSVETVCLLMSQPIVKQMARHGISGADVIKASYAPKMPASISTMTHEEMAKGIREFSEDTPISELITDPIQAAAAQILYHVEYIGRPIKALMDATKITQPKNSFQNSYGETYTRMCAVKDLYQYNKYFVKGDREPRYVFSPEQMASEVYDAFDLDSDTPMTVDDYISGYTGSSNGAMVKPGLAYVQACYDFGFKRPLRYLSRYIGIYGRDTNLLIEDLNNKFPNNNKNNLKEEVVNLLVSDRRIFSTMNAVIREEMESNPGMTASEIRRAYLTSFPQYFSTLLQNYKEHGGSSAKSEGKPRDLRAEFAILRHIIHEQPKSTSKNNKAGLHVLKFSKGGKVDKMIQNELVSSWERMMQDADENIQNLAIQLFKYCMFYNGCQFSPTAFGSYAPASLLREFPEFNQSLRNLSNSMSEADRALFLDQFIRNHIGLFMGTYNSIVGSKTFGKDDLVLRDSFFDAEQKIVNGEEKTVFSPKQGPISAYFDTKEGGMKEYLFITPKWGASKFLFRHVLGADGSYYYENVDTLGKYGFPEYDAEHDLATSSKIGYGSYEGAIETASRTALQNQQAIKDAARRQKQAEILNQLTLLAAEVTDDRSSSVGNDSNYYIKDGKNYTRTHSYMKDSLHIPEMKPVEGYSEAEWALAANTGTAIGSVIDSYARLWFKRLKNGSLSADDQARMNAILDPKQGPLAQNNIEFYNAGRRRDGTPVTLQDHLERYCQTIADQFPGATFYTELNGNPIRICATVNTKDGPVDIGGELDMLVANPDGTFAIVDFKQMRNSRYGFTQFKEKVRSGMLLCEEGSNSYYRYTVQQNCYRSILMNLYPEMEIEGLYLAPAVTTRYVVTVNSDGKINRESNVEGNRLHEGATNERVWLASVAANSGEFESPLFSVPVDTNLSGIPDPARTVQQDQKDDEIKKQAESGSQAFDSYQTIFEHYLPKAMADNYEHHYRYLDGKIKEPRPRNQAEKQMTDEEFKQHMLDMYLGEKGAVMALRTSIPDFNEDMKDEDKVSDSVVEQLITAIKEHRAVKGDDNIKNCK